MSEHRYIDRRNFLRATGIAGITVLAGCADDNADPGDDANGGEPSGDDDDTADESDDDGAEDTPDGNDQEGIDDEDESGEDEDGSDDEEDDDEANDGETSQFNEIVRFEEAYAFEAVHTDPDTGQELTTTGRVDRAGMYTRTDTPDAGLIEVYTVDGETYFVEDETECVLMPGGEQSPEMEEPDPSDEYDDIEVDPERDTIDGEEMYVFELSEEQTAIDVDETYYVSVDTGHIRRIEMDDGVIDFDSWGDVEPIEAPDMECTTMGDGFDGDDVPTLRRPRF
jgi:hypothetical protein